MHKNPSSQAIRSDGPCNKVIENLSRKRRKERVKTSIVLDQMAVGQDGTWRLNNASIRFLRKSWIRSGFDDPKILHHVKAIVADKEYVFMGSHNWTKSSTSFNKETSIYLESKELGREIAQYLKTIEIVPDTVGRPSHTSQKKTKWEKRDLLVKVTNTETGKTLQRADITVRTRKRRNRFETKKRTGFGRNSGKALFKKLITNREYEIIYDKKILKRFKITSDTGTRMIVQINVPPT